MSFKSYEAKHRFYRFPIEGGSEERCSYSFEDEMEGPIFPYFLEADFSNIDGFIRFADDFGLDGFEKLDNADRLSRQLRKEANYSKPISKKFLRSIWESMKAQLQLEQEEVRVLFDLQQSLQNSEDEIEIGDLARVASILKEYTQPKIDIPDFVLASDLKNIEPEWIYDSIVTRCYAELFWLIMDEKKLKECECCGKAFVTTRKNKVYCDRLFLSERARAEYRRLRWKESPEVTEEAKDLMRVAAGPGGVTKQAFGAEWTTDENEIISRLNDPEYQRKKAEVRKAREALRNQREKARAFLSRQTCKKIGPRKTETERLRPEALDRKKQRKKLLNRRNYLKSKGRVNTTDYKKVSIELEQLGQPGGLRND